MVILAGLIVIAGLVLLAERLNEIADENRSDKKIQEQALNGERDEADVYYGRGKLIRATLDVAADEYTGKYASPLGLVWQLCRWPRQSSMDHWRPGPVEGHHHFRSGNQCGKKANQGALCQAALA
jgi:hypothetical protein